MKLPILHYEITMEEEDGEYDGPYSTYPEAHSSLFAVGFALTFWMALFVWPPVLIVVAIQMFRVVYYAHTGRRLRIQGHPLGLPDKYLRQIRDESHYFTPILAVLLVIPGVLLHFFTPIDVIGLLVNLG